MLLSHQLPVGHPGIDHDIFKRKNVIFRALSQILRFHPFFSVRISQGAQHAVKLSIADIEAQVVHTRLPLARPLAINRELRRLLDVDPLTLAVIAETAAEFVAYGAERASGEDVDLAIEAGLAELFTLRNIRGISSVPKEVDK